jgi:hypothetical protein
VVWIEWNSTGEIAESLAGYRSGPESSVVIDLDRAESMQLIAETPYGRVVFTRDALPAIRPVFHLVEEGQIIVRTRITSRLTGTVRPETTVVVAYEADQIDPATHTGWAVVVTGLAHPITDPARVARYEKVLRPWMDRNMDSVIAIEPTMVNGIRLLGPCGQDE